MNIPIYRAKKINSDEYVEGCFNIWEQNGKIYHSIMDIFEFPSPYSNIHIIDTTTLAIHFPDMIDSQGNKIFASLSEDGKGGDVFMWDYEKFIVWFDNQTLKINATNKDNFESNCHDSLNEWYDFTNECYDLKVLGIQE